MARYTIIDRNTHEEVNTDSPKAACQTACRIEEQGHYYAIRDNEADKYVTRLAVYLRY